MRLVRHFIFVIFGLSALLVLVGCMGEKDRDAASTTPEPTLEVEDRIVSALGEVVPEKWAYLSFASGGSDLDIQVSIGEYVRKDDILATVNNLSQQAAVTNAESALSSAQANLDRLEDLEADDSDIDVAQKAVDAAQANLDQAQESLLDTELIAPFNGMIVEIYLRDFETAPPNQPVFLLADLNSLVVETTDLSEVDVARVRTNDPATVVFDALPDVSVNGRVRRIALSPETGAGTYYTVTIKLDEIPEGLRWGMSAFVEIETDPAALLEAENTSDSARVSTSRTPSRTQTETETSTFTATFTHTPGSPRQQVATNTLPGGGYQPPDIPPVTQTYTSQPILSTSTSTSTLTYTASVVPSLTTSYTITPRPYMSPTSTRTPRPVITRPYPTPTDTPTATETFTLTPG